MNAETAFTKGALYWKRIVFDYIDTLVEAGDPSPADVNKLLRRIRRALYTRPFGNIKFEVGDVTIEGNDQKCMQGTILDITDPNAPIYPYYAKVRTVAMTMIRYRRDHGRRKYLCDKHCIGCTEHRDRICLRELVRANLAFKKALTVAISRAKDGFWKQENE